MAEHSLEIDHLLEELIEGGAVALCGQRASAIHPLMFGTGKRGVPQCPDCLNVAIARSTAAAALGKTMPTFTASVAVGKRLADGTPVE